MNKRKGISLIVLVITILVMLILSGVVIVSLQKNNPIENAQKAKILENLKAIESEISLYTATAISAGKQDLELLPLKRDTNGKEVSASSVFGKDELTKMPRELREILYNLIKNKTGDIYDINNVDFSKFYVVDANLIPSVNAFGNRFLVHAVGHEYILISLDGIKYDGKIHYVALPIGKEIGAQFITGDDNTFKITTSGVLSVIGQKNNITGNSSAEFDGFREIKYLRRFKGYKKFRADFDTAYVIDAMDNLWAWGENSTNKLGLGHSNLVLEPVQLLKGKKVKDVYGGIMNTYVITTDNELYIAGSNVHGGLGQGDVEPRQTFVKVNGIDVANIYKILPSCIRESNNAVIVCKVNGQNKVYAIGQNHAGIFQSNPIIPVDITNIHPDLRYADQIGFTGQNLSVRRGNKLYMSGRGGVWGGSPFANNVSNLVEVASNCAKISEEGETRVYYGTDGKVYRCGNNYKEGESWKIVQEFIASTTTIPPCDIDFFGRIKVGEKDMYTVNVFPLEKRIEINLTNYTNAKKVDVNAYKACSIYEDTAGNILAYNYKVSNPNSRMLLEPKIMKENVSSFAVSGERISLIDRDGMLWDTMDKKNTVIKDKVKEVNIDCDAYLALTEDGKVYTRNNGRIGGTGSVLYKPDYVQMKYADGRLVNDVKDIFMFKDREPVGLFLTKDNKLYYSGRVWDNRIPNQGIDGDTGKSPLLQDEITLHPCRVSSGVVDKIAKDIADVCGVFKLSHGTYYGSTTILTKTGDLYSYGSPKINGLNSYNPDFVKINLPAKVIDVKVNDLNTFALLENGEVYAWGYNRYGEYGTGYAVDVFYSTPVKLNLPGAVQVMEIGNGFSIFGLANGSVFGSGKNEYGQLGTGNTVSTTNFVECKVL